MELPQWFGNLVGSTVSQSAFYTEFFRTLLENGKVYWGDIPGWSPRAKSKWIERLVNLEIVERRREGFGGKVFYKLSPQFLAYINKIWRIGKKII